MNICKSNIFLQFLLLIELALDPRAHLLIIYHDSNKISKFRPHRIFAAKDEHRTVPRKESNLNFRPRYLNLKPSLMEPV